MQPLSFLEHAGPQEIIKAYKNGWVNRPREFSQFLSKQKFGQGTFSSKWGALLVEALEEDGKFSKDFSLSKELIDLFYDLQVLQGTDEDYVPNWVCAIKDLYLNDEVIDYLLVKIGKERVIDAEEGGADLFKTLIDQEHIVHMGRSCKSIKRLVDYGVDFFAEKDLFEYVQHYLFEDLNNWKEKMGVVDLLRQSLRKNKPAFRSLQEDQQRNEFLVKLFLIQIGEINSVEDSFAAKNECDQIWPFLPDHNLVLQKSLQNEELGFAEHVASRMDMDFQNPRDFEKIVPIFQGETKSVMALVYLLKHGQHKGVNPHSKEYGIVTFSNLMDSLLDYEKGDARGKRVAEKQGEIFIDSLDLKDLWGPIIQTLSSNQSQNANKKSLGFALDSFCGFGFLEEKLSTCSSLGDSTDFEKHLAEVLATSINDRREVFQRIVGNLFFNENKVNEDILEKMFCRFGYRNYWTSRIGVFANSGIFTEDQKHALLTKIVDMDLISRGMVEDSKRCLENVSALVESISPQADWEPIVKNLKSFEEALGNPDWRSRFEKEDLGRAESLLERIETLKELSDLHKIANSSESPSSQTRRIVKI